MTALLINLLIDKHEKYALFKTTFKDISNSFPECHIKIRGSYSSQCLEYVSNNYFGVLKTYQNLAETDWIKSTLKILSALTSRSVFIYFEDHRLVGSKRLFEDTIAIFDDQDIDYLCYSFFHSISLSRENILPLRPITIDNYSIFNFNESSKELINKISPNYYAFSLVSIVSVDYLKMLLSSRDFRIKLYNRKLSSLINLLLKYPRNRLLFNGINRHLSRLGIGFCIYPPSSPFNAETMCLEITLDKTKNYKYAICHDELFANYDDDNVVYGESLIKRGLYPFSPIASSPPEFNYVSLFVKVLKDESYDATYYSRIHRIRNAPVISIVLESGSISIKTKSTLIILKHGQSINIYSNMCPLITALDDSTIHLTVYDEVF